MSRMCVFIMGVVLVLSSCGTKQEGMWFCDVETEAAEPFILGGERVEGNSHSGAFALALSQRRPYGMTLQLDGLKAGEVLTLAAWKKGNGGAIVVSADTDPPYYQALLNTDSTDSGWERLSGTVMLPPHLSDAAVKVYLYHPGDSTILVDDFRIRRTAGMVFPEFEGLSGIEIRIGKDGIRKLRRKRKEAFQMGILESSGADYVGATVIFGGQRMEAEIRLKGDKPDHLAGEKWSFRVKLKHGAAFRGMQSFSLQSPAARHFLDEWLLHRLFERAGVLSTNYSFIPLRLNGHSLGLYAVEEHFSERLPAAAGRAAAEIYKYSEDGFWETLSLEGEYGTDQLRRLPVFEAAGIDCFGESPKDGAERRQRGEGMGLMYQMQFSLAPASSLLNPDRTARFLAITDMGRAWHGLRWHNMRFYHDIRSGKLEPVAYDAYVEQGVYSWFRRPLAGFREKDSCMYYMREESIVYQMFNDPYINQQYHKFLQEYSKESFWEAFWDPLKPEADSLAELIQREFPGYTFSGGILKAGALKVRQLLAEASFTDGKFVPDFRSFPYDCGQLPFLPEIFFKVYAHEGSGLCLINFHCDTVWVSAVRDESGRVSRLGGEAFFLPPFDKANPLEFRNLYPSLSSEPAWVGIRLSLADEIQWLPVIQGGCPEDWPKAMQPEYLAGLSRVQPDSIIRIGPGYLTFRQNLLVPPGRQVHIQKGTMLDFVEGAALVSESPIRAAGTLSQPVVFLSSDRSSPGIHLLYPDKKSLFSFVVFEGFRPKGNASAVLMLSCAEVSLEHIVFRESEGEKIDSLVCRPVYSPEADSPEKGENVRK